MPDPRTTDLAELLGLIVHDLRNPAATLGANISFFKEVAGVDADDDLREALQDMEAALVDLRRGLDQLGWISRWIGDVEVLQVADGDVVSALEAAVGQVPEVRCTMVTGERPLRARGGGTLARLVEILLVNSRVHGRGSDVQLSARRDGSAVVVEVRDGGPAVAESLREQAFTVEGQRLLKGKAEGRYGRAAGLLAAAVLAEAIGATLEVGGRDGDAWFRIRLVAT